VKIAAVSPKAGLPSLAIRRGQPLADSFPAAPRTEICPTNILTPAHIAPHKY